MASLTKLKLNEDLKRIKDKRLQIEIKNQTISVKQYLPVDEKMLLINDIINESYDNFIVPGKISICKKIEIVKRYTDISFTENQLENPCKLYDLLTTSGVLEKIISVIPKDELIIIDNWLHDSIEAFYKYNYSALGILNTVSKDYSNLEFDAKKIQEELSDKDNLKLLRDIVLDLG